MPRGNRTTVIVEPSQAQWDRYLEKWFIPLLITAILVNAGGLFIPVLEPDGSLYATIAKTIARTGDFINLKVDGADWLDKPHFPFWMAALSFRLMGVNAFAYKFPALLFWAAGAFYTWRLAFSLYGKSVAQLSTLMYVSAAHLVISNNDVRAEPYLTGLIIGAVYHFYKASRANRTAGASKTFRASLGGGSPAEGSWLPHIFAGSLLAACACMTKGPFVLITIGAGFIIDWCWGREWSHFRQLRWWLAIVLTGIFMLPELLCLYLQFDRHPEKLVFGHMGVSGIRFFFWDAQFGRFFNTGPIKGNGDPFFYFHTLLWAFLPWSILLYAAVIRKPRRTIPGDLICLGSALATFVVFSLSRFQLPHYLNILFPFFAILTAVFLYNIRRRATRKAIGIVQDVINSILPILLLLLCWFFRFPGWPLLMAVITILAILPFVLFRSRTLPSPIVRSFWMSMLTFAVINFILYPAMLRYQAGTQAARYLDAHPELTNSAPANTAVAAGASSGATAAPAAAPIAYLLKDAPVSFSFEFDAPGTVARVPVHNLPPLSPGGSILVFAPTTFADTLVTKGFQATPVAHFDYFHISQLTGEFINYRTRTGVLTPWALFSVSTR